MADYFDEERAKTEFLRVVVTFESLRMMILVKESYLISDLIKEAEKTYRKLCDAEMTIRTLKNSVNAILPYWYPVSPLLKDGEELFAYTAAPADVVSIPRLPCFHCTKTSPLEAKSYCSSMRNYDSGLSSHMGGRRRVMKPCALQPSCNDRNFNHENVIVSSEEEEEEGNNVSTQSSFFSLGEQCTENQKRKSKKKEGKAHKRKTDEKLKNKIKKKKRKAETVKKMEVNEPETGNTTAACSESVGSSDRPENNKINKKFKKPSATVGKTQTEKRDQEGSPVEQQPSSTPADSPKLGQQESNEETRDATTNSKKKTTAEKSETVNRSSSIVEESSADSTMKSKKKKKKKKSVKNSDKKSSPVADQSHSSPKPVVQSETSKTSKKFSKVKSSARKADTSTKESSEIVETLAAKVERVEAHMREEEKTSDQNVPKVAEKSGGGSKLVYRPSSDSEDDRLNPGEKAAKRDTMQNKSSGMDTSPKQDKVIVAISGSTRRGGPSETGVKKGIEKGDKSSSDSNDDDIDNDDVGKGNGIASGDDGNDHDSNNEDDVREDNVPDKPDDDHTSAHQITKTDGDHDDTISGESEKNVPISRNTSKDQEMETELENGDGESIAGSQDHVVPSEKGSKNSRKNTGNEIASGVKENDDDGGEVKNEKDKHDVAGKDDKEHEATQERSADESSDTSSISGKGDGYTRLAQNKDVGNVSTNNMKLSDNSDSDSLSSDHESSWSSSDSVKDVKNETKSGKVDTLAEKMGKKGNSSKTEANVDSKVKTKSIHKSDNVTEVNAKLDGAGSKIVAEKSPKKGNTSKIAANFDGKPRSKSRSGDVIDGKLEGKTSDTETKIVAGESGNAGKGLTSEPSATKDSQKSNFEESLKVKNKDKTVNDATITKDVTYGKNTKSSIKSLGESKAKSALDKEHASDAEESDDSKSTNKFRPFTQLTPKTKNKDDDSVASDEQDKTKWTKSKIANNLPLQTDNKKTSNVSDEEDIEDDRSMNKIKPFTRPSVKDKDTNLETKSRTDKSKDDGKKDGMKTRSKSKVESQVPKTPQRSPKASKLTKSPTIPQRRAVAKSAEKVRSWLLANDVSGIAGEPESSSKSAPLMSNVLDKSKSNLTTEPEQMQVDESKGETNEKSDTKTNEATAGGEGDKISTSTKKEKSSGKRKLDRAVKKTEQEQTQSSKKTKKRKQSGKKQAKSTETEQETEGTNETDKTNGAAAAIVQPKVPKRKSTPLKLPKKSKGLAALFTDEEKNVQKPSTKKTATKPLPWWLKSSTPTGFLSPEKSTERKGNQTSSGAKQRKKRMSLSQKSRTTELNDKEAELLWSGNLNLETLLNDETIKW